MERKTTHPPTPGKRANSGIAPRDSLTNHNVTGKRILAFPMLFAGIDPRASVWSDNHIHLYDSLK